jgi:hypothetical protein
MDAIVFVSSGEILYRPRGEHKHSPGMDNVLSVYPVCLSTLPRGPRPPSVKNLAGFFVSLLDPGQHGNVSIKAWQHFGDHQEMYHVEGSVTVYNTRVQFKGCRGLCSMQAIAADLRLDSPASLVHMGVFGASIGRKVHTGLGCFLENRLAHRFRSMRVCSRILDLNSVVKLRIDRYDAREMPILGGDHAPKCIDILISSNGSINMRMSWNRCQWDKNIETRVLAFCGWMAGIVKECS